jgi:hypothetical protein
MWSVPEKENYTRTQLEFIINLLINFRLFYGSASVPNQLRWIKRNLA